MTRLASMCIALSLTLLAGVAGANQVLDNGTFEVYQGSKALGVEVFAFEKAHDSLFVHCEVKQKIPNPKGDLTLDKYVRLLVKNFDGELILYESVQHLNGKKLVRAIVPKDTALTIYREGDNVGEGNTIVRPPGRMFIIDPQVFVLFDMICRDVADREFDTRKITMFVLAHPDTLVDGSVTNLGTDRIRWGAKPVQAKKVRIGDTTSEFFAWIGPRGRMLQLTEPKSGLRVVRKAPAVKPPSPK